MWQYFSPLLMPLEQITVPKGRQSQLLPFLLDFLLGFYANARKNELAAPKWVGDEAGA